MEIRRHLWCRDVRCAFCREPPGPYCSQQLAEGGTANGGSYVINAFLSLDQLANAILSALRRASFVGHGLLLEM